MWLCLIFRTPKIRDGATRFIVSLAVSDFLYSGINTPIIGYSHFSKDFLTNENCPIITFIGYSNYGISIYNMVLMAIQCYVVVCHISIYEKVSALIIRISVIVKYLY